MHRFELIDVFHNGPFSGNPLAVVHDADDLSPTTMQAMTRWFNLSETAFLLKPTEPTADYRVRIFTLERELPFAGHPTLGSCHAWLGAGGVPAGANVVQQCGAGLVPLRRSAETLAFAAPPLLRAGPVDEVQVLAIADVLRIDRAAIIAAEWVDNGPGWIAVLLESAAAVLAVVPRRDPAARMDIGIVGPHPAGSEIAFELRALFSDQHGTLIEDPVTGSLNASVAQWLIGSGRAPASYVAAQGTAIGRSGRIFIESDSSGVWVGGRTTTLVSGTTAV